MLACSCLTLFSLEYSHMRCAHTMCLRVLIFTCIQYVLFITIITHITHPVYVRAVLFLFYSLAAMSLYTLSACQHISTPSIYPQATRQQPWRRGLVDPFWCLLYYVTSTVCQWCIPWCDGTAPRHICRRLLPNLDWCFMSASVATSIRPSSANTPT